MLFVDFGFGRNTLAAFPTVVILSEPQASRRIFALIYLQTLS